MAEKFTGQGMNKKNYLEELKRHLEKSGSLSGDEVAEILADTDSHFEHGLEKGKTEESIAVTLGEPRLLAEGYLAQNLVRERPRGVSISKSSLVLFRAMKALFIIAPMNFIFMLGPFLLGGFVVFIGWVLALGVGFTAIAIGGSYLSVGGAVSPGFWVSLSVISFALGLFGAGILAALAMFKVTEWSVRGLWAWIRWNINFLMSA